MSRYASRFNKRDANEREIVGAMGKLGIPWIEGGPLDGWVWLGEWVPTEIKMAKGKLTAGQKLFISDCTARKRPCFVLRSVDDLLAQVGAKA